MNVMIWNVQGIGNTWTSNALLSHVRKVSPYIVFLLESKLFANQIPGLARRLGFRIFTVLTELVSVEA